MDQLGVVARDGIEPTTRGFSVLTPWTIKQEVASAKVRRDIGQEILQGLRELKRVEVGRVIDVPNVASIREKTGLSQARFAVLSEYPFAHFRTGSKAGGRRKVQHERCCSW